MSETDAPRGVVDFSGRAVAGELPAEWIHGAPPGSKDSDPPLQVAWYDEHTVVMRQNKALTYEAPFLYLLFGNDRALLLDTGAVEERARMPLRDTVDDLVSAWLSERRREGYALVVAHTHGHGDHVAGDAQFADRPDTVVVPRELEEVQDFFGFRAWPRETVRLDLGGRVLEVTGIPGHHRASIAVYDPWTGWLLTGDTVYPGRLYVEDPAAFRASLDALVDIAQSRHVTAVLGTHIEMSRTAGRDYPLGTKYQPDEPPLAMTVDQLRAVRNAAHTVGDRGGAHVYDDFALYVGRSTAPMLRQVARRLRRDTALRLHLRRE